MMDFNVQIDTSGLERWGDKFQKNLKKAVGKAMFAEARRIKAAMRAQVSGAMDVKKQSFLNGFNARVVDDNELPAIHVGTRIRWAGIFETGGTINGKMLIPLHGRVGRKGLRAYVDELMRSGNAFFVKGKDGRIILMAENIAENDRPLRGFKRRYRKAENIKRLKRGTAVPIAMLVNKVTVSKKLNVRQLVADRLPVLKRAIEKEIRAIT